MQGTNKLVISVMLIHFQKIWDNNNNNYNNDSDFSCRRIQIVSVEVNCVRDQGRQRRNTNIAEMIEAKLQVLIRALYKKVDQQ